MNVGAQQTRGNSRSHAVQYILRARRIPRRVCQPLDIPTGSRRVLICVAERHRRVRRARHEHEKDCGRYCAYRYYGCVEPTSPLNQLASRKGTDWRWRMDKITCHAAELLVEL